MRVPQAVRRGDGARERRGRTGSGSTVDRRGVAVRSRNGSRAVAGACHVSPCSPAPQRRRRARTMGARPGEGSRRGRGASGGASAKLVTGRDPRRGWPLSERVHKDGESLGGGLCKRAAPGKGESLAARETGESLAAGKPREISVPGQGSSKARAQGVRVRGANCQGLGADRRAQSNASARIEATVCTNRFPDPTARSAASSPGGTSGASEVPLGVAAPGAGARPLADRVRTRRSGSAPTRKPAGSWQSTPRCSTISSRSSLLA